MAEHLDVEIPPVVLRYLRRSPTLVSNEHVEERLALPVRFMLFGTFNGQVENLSLRLSQQSSGKRASGLNQNASILHRQELAFTDSRDRSGGAAGELHLLGNHAVGGLTARSGTPILACHA